MANPTVPTLPNDIISVHTAISQEDEAGYTARNKALSVGNSGMPEDRLDALSKNLTQSLYSNLKGTSAKPTWNFFLKKEKDGKLSPHPLAAAFLVPFQDTKDGPIVLRLIAAPQPVTADILTDNHFPSMMGVSGLSAYTRFKRFTPDDFTSGDIAFTRVDYDLANPASNFNHLRAISIPFTPAERQALKGYLGSSCFRTACDQGILRRLEANDSNVAWSRPSSTTTPGRSYPLFLPAVWPLPQGHTVAVLTDIPLPTNPDDFVTAITALGANSEHKWIRSDPLFAAWLKGVKAHPSIFCASSSQELLFSEAPDLTTYQACIRCARFLAADCLAAHGHITLYKAIMSDTALLNADPFPPPSIDQTTSQGDLSTLRALTDFPPMTPVFPFAHPPLPPTPAPTPTVAPFTTALPAFHPVDPNPTPIPSVQREQAPSPSLFSQVIASSSISLSAPPTPKLSQPILHLLAAGACHYATRTRLLPPDLTPFAFPTADPSNLVSIMSTTGLPTPSQLNSHLLLCPLHPMMITCLQSGDDGKAAAKRMRDRFESSRTSHQSNIVSAHLLDCIPSTSRFFSSPIWSQLVKGQLCSSPLSTDAHQAFSLINTLLINPAYDVSKRHGTPLLPSGGFASFSDVQTFLWSCKWFIMVSYQDPLYQHTILFQGLTLIDSLLESQNYPAKWSSRQFRPAMASYAILEAVFNLFAIVGSLASNASPTNLVEVLITSVNPATPSFLLPPRIADATLSIDVDVSLAGWRRDTQLNLQSISAPNTQMQSLLQIPTSDINHYLFRSPKRIRLDEASDSESDQPAKKKKRKKDPDSTPTEKPRKPRPGAHILVPSNSSTTIAMLLEHLNEGKITPPRLPKMSGIRNTTGVALCFPYLLGQECSAQGCGYHLAVNHPDKLPGSSHADYAPFHKWVSDHKPLFKLSQLAHGNSYLRLSGA